MTNIEQLKKEFEESTGYVLSDAFINEYVTQKIAEEQEKEIFTYFAKLIQKEREEAVREFIEKVKKETVKNGWEWKADGGSNVFGFIEGEEVNLKSKSGKDKLL